MVWPQCQTWLGSWPQLPQWQLDTSCLNHLLIESSPPAPNYPGLLLVEVKFTHTKTDDYFLYILNLYCLKDKRTFPQTHDKKLGRRCPYTFGHIVLISLVFPPPEASPPPAANLHLTLVFLCVIFFEYLKKKKPIMNPPPLTQYDSDASSTNDWEWMTNGVWMISRCFPERGRLAPHQSAAWHATWRQRRREMKHGYLLEIAIIERLRPMTSNESPFSPEWTLTQPSFTHVGMTVTHRRPGLGLCARHLCLHSVVTDRVTTVSQKKKEKKKGHFFAPSVKSTQIGLLDEWTCLCPFHAGCPFVMPPLLRKQQRRGLYLLSESSWCSSSLCWWGRVHLPSWISSRSLNNFYDWAWLTRKAEKPRLTFLWVWMFFNLTLSAGLLTSHHHFYPAPGGFSWLHRF